MNWEDECYLLSKKKFRENANIINVFTSERGKISGIVYGGNSRKIRNFLQISNKLYIINNSKSENKIGYFKAELIKPITPLFFDNKEKTSALISICSLLNILLPDSQPYKNIYGTVDTPILILEAMAANCVVISSNDSNVVDIYGESQSLIQNIPGSLEQLKSLTKLFLDQSWYENELNRVKKSYAKYLNQSNLSLNNLKDK